VSGRRRGRSLVRARGCSDDTYSVLPAVPVVDVPVGRGIHGKTGEGGLHVLGPHTVDVELVLVLARYQVDRD